MGRHEKGMESKDIGKRGYRRRRARDMKREDRTKSRHVQRREKEEN